MNIRTFTTPLLLTLAVAAQAVCAEDTETPAAAKKTSMTTSPQSYIWQAKLSNTSIVSVFVPQIVSVALHPYMLNGVTRVTELTIDTNGNNSIRFYYVHPQDDTQPLPGVSAKGVKKKIGQHSPVSIDEETIASVKFPEGAYAHTIEYQVNSPDALMALYESIMTAWWKKGSKKPNVDLSE